MICDKGDDLKNLYILLKPITDGLKDLIQYLLDHIKNEGNETVVNLKGENVSKFIANYKCALTRITFLNNKKNASK